MPKTAISRAVLAGAAVPPCHRRRPPLTRTARQPKGVAHADAKLLAVRSLRLVVQDHDL
jgi:hypothetical protein